MKARVTWLAALPLLFAMAACGGDSDKAADPGTAEEKYPTKQVNWIVPFAAGGGADASFRVFQKYAEPLSKSKMQVTNIDGAGGVTGWTQFVNSKPDGYTMSLATPPFNIIPKKIQSKETPYELDQFTYVCSFAASPNALFIKTGDKRFNDLAGVIAYAKANPGKLTAGTTGAVGTDTFHMYQLQAAAGVKFKLVPFDSATDVSAALTSGQIDVVFSDTSWVRLGGGKMTAVAVAAADPHPDFPDIPTYKQSNLDIVGVRLRAPAAPPKTPATVVKYWEDICKKATEDPKLKEELGKIGQPVQFLSAAETTALVNQMATDIEKIVSEQGLAK